MEVVELECQEGTQTQGRQEELQSWRYPSGLR